MLARLFLLDQFWSIWTLLAVGPGLGLARLFPALNDALNTIKVGSGQPPPSPS